MSKRQSPGAAGWAPTIGWRLFQLLTVAGLILVGWRLLGHVPYRIDIDVYRMGGRAWLDNQPLYADGAIFHTQGGLDLPFTYPPLAAILFAPFAWLSLPAASVAITATTLVLLIISTVIVLTRLNIWPETRITSEPAWVRRCWLATALVVPAVIWLEPIRSNFEFGQINVVLMTLVIADCVPRRTPWPRGMLLGLAIALKLTPAVFVLYFLLRRDFRSLLRTAAAAAVATLAGFVLAWTDSIEYWTETVRNTDRIGTATLNTNQNIAGTLARFGLSEGPRFVLWVLACFAVLALTVWAVRRVLRSGTDESPVVALICVAMFGLVVSPVSWSHHWVWSLPTLVVTCVLAYRMRRRNPAALYLAAVTVIGFALMVWTPIALLTPHHETAASVIRQLAADSYLWWGLAVIVVIGAVSTPKAGKTAAVPATPLVHLSGGEGA
ncbi:polyprenol-phosphate-mannose-dependent alpha-(1,2)-phosphatidylinositol mannoside mannosyltransferase [Mycolicibacterium conceptionense]|uniref:Polyprenol-phosphate-mannose-dependent alpha-(1,2)-phosphatidylinositol mannoside mannosyltransferase n=2 Tax=Mycolicibacterium TaxID=1866885 RepID=A0ABR5FNK4_9MYCO|nr:MULTISPECIES: glycosyltransferase 87 family protein [Mycolicibacterium]KLI08728.1 polyprenol-phosphate-mannose-dependent alpha-(1,2)-phosphatidylinositol mannoside mannosyltransferase [Mycolicibacterium senegalense]KLO48419.1 polyprenol-phosphate-mannose-dependent alpha-(1,2)-phosphatidylinositol mannoside mannosyltransferase [Mycolicibacterium senegalense]KMV20406.1 polyprenol-phosphate-mannose-dependent alpha-(1,2)-phosphatidylinositol mannoside mannosyltransferase [Mycolicibacterium concep